MNMTVRILTFRPLLDEDGRILSAGNEFAEESLREI
jgi:hypothetical protein